MQELTFETILRLPQMDLKKTLKAELKSRGCPVTDKPGYLYAEGTIPVLLAAHMDTVHRQPVEQICYSADGAVAMSPQGIGGDDRCGVWMILQILCTAKCHVLFCEDEEVGCVGAKKFTRGSLRPQVNYIVELDRRGSNDAVFTAAITRSLRTSSPRSDLKQRVVHAVIYPTLRRIWKQLRSISAAAIIANTNGMSTSA